MADVEAHMSIANDYEDNCQDEVFALLRCGTECATQRHGREFTDGWFLGPSAGTCEAETQTDDSLLGSPGLQLVPDAQSAKTRAPHHCSGCRVAAVSQYGSSIFINRLD